MQFKKPYGRSLLPIFLHGSDAWSLASISSRLIVAFEQWCLLHILQIPYLQHITNDRNQMQDLPIASHSSHHKETVMFIKAHCSSQWITASLTAANNCFPLDWQCTRGRPRWTWLRMVELHLQQHNLSLSSAWNWALDNSKWCQLVEMALSYQGHPTQWKWSKFSVIKSPSFATSKNPGNLDIFHLHKPEFVMPKAIFSAPEMEQLLHVLHAKVCSYYV